MSFPQYPEYKDSGVEWLMSVPTHWKVDRLKASIRSCRNGIWGDESQGDTNDIPCVRIADFDRNKLQVTLDDPTIRNVTEKERASRTLRKDDLLLEKSGGGEHQPVGCVVLYKDDRPAVCSNFVAKIELSDEMVPSYWRYAHAAAYSIRLTTGSINQTSGIQNLDQDRYFNERFAFPPSIEQESIANFLEYETFKIDNLIDEQLKLIELLKEKREAVISHAVTKGIDPDVKMKDSGVELLGKVPEHWSIVPLKFIADVQTGLAKGKDYFDKETIKVPYLRVANVQDGYLDLEEVSFIEIAASDLKKYLLKNGDVLMNEGGDFDKLGRGCIWKSDIEGCIHQNHVFAVRPRGVSSEWLNTITGTDYAQFYFMSRSKQSTNLASISSSNLMELPVLLPPKNEQLQIMSNINNSVDEIDSLMIESKKLNLLLVERRSALIFAAVTGQIDVRNFALRMEAA